MTLMTMNDTEKNFCYNLVPKISAVHNWTFSIIRWRQSLNVKIFPVSTCKDLMEGRMVWKLLHDDGDDKANGIRFAFYLFISSRDGKFLTFHIWRRALTQQQFDAFEWIRLWEENLENIQMRFREYTENWMWGFSTQKSDW